MWFKKILNNAMRTLEHRPNRLSFQHSVVRPPVDDEDLPEFVETVHDQDGLRSMHNHVHALWSLPAILPARGARRPAPTTTGIGACMLGSGLRLRLRCWMVILSSAASIAVRTEQADRGAVLANGSGSADQTARLRSKRCQTARS
jgi:hypothetical protein